MIVYLYDDKTGEYLQEYSPQKNPKNPTEYLYPYNSTTIKPDEKTGYVPIFNGTNWILTEDYRGQEIINKETKEISKVKTTGKIADGFILFSEYKKTKEYKQEEKLKEKNANIQRIKNSITELDMKRIRAIAEPSVREDGIAWIDFYTSEIQDLRQQLKEAQ